MARIGPASLLVVVLGVFSGVAGCGSVSNTAYRDQSPDLVVRGLGAVEPFLDCVNRAYVDRTSRYAEVKVSQTWIKRPESGEVVVRTPADVLVMINGRQDGADVVAEIREGGAWAFSESDAQKAEAVARSCLSGA